MLYLHTVEGLVCGGFDHVFVISELLILGCFLILVKGFQFI